MGPFYIKFFLLFCCFYSSYLLLACQELSYNIIDENGALALALSPVPHCISLENDRILYVVLVRLSDGSNSSNISSIVIVIIIVNIRINTCLCCLLLFDNYILICFLLMFSSCPQTKQWWRPFRRLKTAVFMFASQAPDMDG